MQSHSFKDSIHIYIYHISNCTNIQEQLCIVGVEISESQLKGSMTAQGSIVGMRKPYSV